MLLQHVKYRRLSVRLPLPRPFRIHLPRRLCCFRLRRRLQSCLPCPRRDAVEAQLTQLQQQTLTSVQQLVEIRQQLLAVSENSQTRTQKEGVSMKMAKC